jgi:hypothetical protein
MSETGLNPEATHWSSRTVGHPPGTMVCPITNKIVPIPGSITYENGKPVIVPLPERKPRREKLVPVSIEELLEQTKRIENAKTGGQDAESQVSSAE